MRVLFLGWEWGGGGVVAEVCGKCRGGLSKIRTPIM